MEVVEVDSTGQTAKVALSGNELEVNISLVNAKVGDYVLVHAGCAIETVNKELAGEINHIYEQIKDSYEN